MEFRRPDIKKIMHDEELRERAIIRAVDAFQASWNAAGVSPREVNRLGESLLNPDQPRPAIVRSIVTAAELVGGSNAPINVLFDQQAMSKFKSGFGQ